VEVGGGRLVGQIHVSKDCMVLRAVYSTWCGSWWVRYTSLKIVWSLKPYIQRGVEAGGGRRDFGHGLWCAQDLDRTQRLLPFVREYPVVYVPTAS
jgi:hypothetical protein